VKKKNVKTATENTSSNSSKTLTLGDSDMLAALKAKMEKSKKIILVLNRKSNNVGLFLYF
jgi:hypothetical protein